MKKTIKIFILEDNRHFGNVLKVHLSQEGREVSYFDSELTMIAQLDEKPDILILDHQLEYCTGLEVLEIVKRKCGTDSHVIYLSAQEYLDVTLKALKNGALEYIEKSSNPLRGLERVIAKLSSHTECFTIPFDLEVYRTDSDDYLTSA